MVQGAATKDLSVIETLNSRAAFIRNLTSLPTQFWIIATTFGVANDDKFGIMAIIGFWWMLSLYHWSIPMSCGMGPVQCYTAIALSVYFNYAWYPDAGLLCGVSYMELFKTRDGSFISRDCTSDWWRTVEHVTQWPVSLRKLTQYTEGVA